MSDNEDYVAYIRLHHQTIPIPRAAGFARVTDQIVLARIAKHETEQRVVRVTAVARMTDQTLLARIAKSDPGWYVRAAAVARLGRVRPTGKRQFMVGLCLDA